MKKTINFDISATALGTIIGAGLAAATGAGFAGGYFISRKLHHVDCDCCEEDDDFEFDFEAEDELADDMRKAAEKKMDEVNQEAKAEKTAEVEEPMQEP